jgi:hypothetical protein
MEGLYSKPVVTSLSAHLQESNLAAGFYLPSTKKTICYSVVNIQKSNIRHSGKHYQLDLPTTGMLLPRMLYEVSYY